MLLLLFLLRTQVKEAKICCRRECERERFAVNHLRISYFGKVAEDSRAAVVSQVPAPVRKRALG